MCPLHLSMGGSHLNAIELASAVRRHGHEVLMYAPDGILARRVEEAGIERIPAVRGSGLSPTGIAKLGTLVKQRRIGLVHAYEWAPSVEAAFGAGLWRNTPVLMSVMAMEVPGFLPKHLPITVGTTALAEKEKLRRRSVYLLEPPIDMAFNRSTDVGGARRLWGVPENDFVVSLVSMLTTDLEKLQGVLTAIAMVDQLAQQHSIRLLIAGDGEGYEQVSIRAARVNDRHGRIVVQVVGYQEDASTIYEAADAVIGMGGSAIKGMAFAKPLIVQGAAGFWQLLTPATADGFLRSGWFGDGGKGIRDLEGALLELLSSQQRCEELGTYGRLLVQDRYSLDKAGSVLSSVYEEVAKRHVRRSEALPSLTRSAVEVARFRRVMRTGNVVRKEQWSRSGVSL